VPQADGFPFLVFFRILVPEEKHPGPTFQHPSITAKWSSSCLHLETLVVLLVLYIFPQPSLLYGPCSLALQMKV